jgi:hypothetical protein
MPVSVPVVPKMRSVTVRDGVPAVFSVALKVWTPPSAAVNV